MKKILCFIIVMLLLSVHPALSATPAVSGKIIDILDSGIITIQLSKGHPLKGGDTVSLTYMAGSLPMAIGDYEITITTNVICLAKPLVMTMPPSNGMVVEIAWIKRSDSTGSVGKPVASTPLKKSPVATEPVEIVGSVTAVKGDEITVKTISSGTPQVGWLVDLFYVTSQGKDLPVGTWKVRSVAGKNLTAVKIKGVGNANKQLKAVIYNHKKQAASQAVPPPPIQTARVPVAATRTRRAAPPVKQQQPIRLLGETLPAQPPGRAVANPYKTQPALTQPALPPGVQKKTQQISSQPQDPEVAHLLDLLKSSIMNDRRTAAKIIYRRRYSDAVLHKQMDKELLDRYLTARDKLEVDTLSWMCKALTASGDRKYYDTLYTVSKKAKSRKLRKYAKKMLRLF